MESSLLKESKCRFDCRRCDNWSMAPNTSAAHATSYMQITSASTVGGRNNRVTCVVDSLKDELDPVRSNSQLRFDLEAMAGWTRGVLPVQLYNP